MSQALQISNAIEAALVQGDLSKLTSEQRVEYFRAVCASVGLNPLTRPFEYLLLSGKVVLYARKDATDQLRKIHRVSITSLDTKVVNDICVVTATARDGEGKEDSEVGAVDIKGLAGEKLANAMMKASTKAKRRVTLSICGMGILDETEVDSIPDAKPFVEPAPKVETKPLAIAPPAEEEDDIPAFALHRQEEDLGAYVIPFGKYQGKTLEQVGPYDLNGYVNFLKKSSRQSDEGRAMIAAADKFLATRDRSQQQVK